MEQAIIYDLGLMDYQRAHDIQLDLLKQKKIGELSPDIFLMVEHPSVFTLGRRGSREHLAVSEDFLKTRGVPVIHVERGGDITYHGQGQVVVYPIMELRRTGLTVSDYIDDLEEVMLRVSAESGVMAQRDPRNHGVWVGECKLGSVGIAIRHGITYHGLALNVNVALEAFDWIHPCGLTEIKMTSLARELCRELPMDTVKSRFTGCLETVFATKLTHLPWPGAKEN